MCPSAINPIPASINVAGTALNTTTLPTQLLPDCNNGVAEETRSANFKIKGVCTPVQASYSFFVEMLEFRSS